MDMGASFCQVSKIRPDDKEMPCATFGTQKWNGAIPSFMVRAIVMSMDAVGLSNFITVHWPENIKLMIMAIISNIEAVDWVRKYLVDASLAHGLYFFIIMGIIASIFISNPIQMSSQWELIMKMIVPSMIVDRIVIKIIGFISTGRI